MRALYDSKSRTIDDLGIKKNFSKKAKIQSWLDLEAALATAQGELGVIPVEAARNIVQNCSIDRVDLHRMDEIFQEIGHNFVRTGKVLVEACDSESGKYVHFGVTTQNIQQSAQLYMAKKVHDKLMSFLDKTMENLAGLCEEHKHTIMAGRTHGKHAVPITYGYKASVWLQELMSAKERLIESEKRVFTVMMGGAVGAFHSMGDIGPQVQDHVALQLGMYSMPVPSRNARVFRTEYISNMCLLATTFHKMAEEVYQTSCEEFSEVSEAFKKGTVGSSTMPQKVNPKLAKGIIANSQKLYSALNTSLLAVARPFEGDSSSYFLYDSCMEEAMQCSTEILLRAEELTRTIVINSERMYQNVMLTKGLINSEYVMMRLTDRLGKDKAHHTVYELAMEAASGTSSYSEVLKSSPVLAELFSEQEIDDMLKPESYIGLCAVTAQRTADRARAFIRETESR